MADRRTKIKVGKVLLAALRLLEERHQRDREAVINDFLVEAGEDATVLWQLEPEGSQLYLVRRWPGKVEKPEEDSAA